VDFNGDDLRECLAGVAVAVSIEPIRVAVLCVVVVLGLSCVEKSEQSLSI
jgi:hypothetical protein